MMTNAALIMVNEEKRITFQARQNFLAHSKPLYTTQTVVLHKFIANL